MQWSWVFLSFYVVLMLGIGLYTQKKIKHADDFATARGSYGPFFLALAFAASTASGATFLGTPALSYEWGLAAQWSNFLYPIGNKPGIDLRQTGWTLRNSRKFSNCNLGNIFRT